MSLFFIILTETKGAVHRSLGLPLKKIPKSLKPLCHVLLNDNEIESVSYIVYKEDHPIITTIKTSYKP